MCLTYHGYVPGHVLYNKRSVDSNTRMQATLGCRCGSNVSFEFCNEYMKMNLDLSVTDDNLQII